MAQSAESMAHGAERMAQSAESMAQELWNGYALYAVFLAIL
jgi:hypothetical protein